MVHDDDAEVAVAGFMGEMQVLRPHNHRTSALPSAISQSVRHRRVGRTPPPLDTIAEVYTPLAIFGGNGQFRRGDDIERAVGEPKAGTGIVVYDDTERFMPRRAARPDDAADAWRRVLAFLNPS